MRLVLPRRGDDSVSAIFYGHATVGGIAVDPPRQSCGRLSRIAIGPGSGEDQLEIPVAPDSGDRQIRAHQPRRGARDGVAFPMQLHHAGEGADIAGIFDFPRTGDFAAILKRLPLRGSDPYVGEVRLLIGRTPQTYSALQVLAFEPVYYQGGIRSAVDKQAGAAALHLNSNVDPRFELHVRVRLIDPRPGSAQHVPIEVRRFNILHDVIAHGLILRVRIAGPNVEHLVVACVGARAECDSDEAGIADTGGRGHFHRDIRFDGAVGELGAAQHRETFAFLLYRHSDGF